MVLPMLQRSHRAAFLLLAMCLPLAGCALRVIAPYDATLDSTMTQVQQQTEVFFTDLQFAAGTDAASYNASKAFYQRIEPTLRTLLTRAQATPRGHAVADQIANILAGVEKLQATHQRDGTLNPALLALERSAFESQFRSFFALELALKSGPAPSTSALAPAIQP